MPVSNPHFYVLCWAASCCSVIIPVVRHDLIKNWAISFCMVFIVVKCQSVSHWVQIVMSRSLRSTIKHLHCCISQLFSLYHQRLPISIKARSHVNRIGCKPLPVVLYDLYQPMSSLCLVAIDSDECVVLASFLFANRCGSSSFLLFVVKPNDQKLIGLAFQS